MKKQKDFRVYVLISHPYAFVGKTQATEIKPILWRHMRGENKYTKAYLAKKNSQQVNIYVLEQIHVDVHMAYRHEIAFIRMLMDEGYHMLNSKGMLEDARDIHEITQNILDSLKSISLQERFARGSLDIPSFTAPSPPPSEFHQKAHASPLETLSERITIRTTPTAKSVLNDYCKQTGLNQRHAFEVMLVYLLDQDRIDSPVSAADFSQALMQTYCEEIERLKQKNAELNAELTTLKQTLASLKKQHTTEKNEHVKFLRKGIATYMSYFESSLQDNNLLGQDSYKNFQNNSDEKAIYKYPEQECFSVFYPEKVLRGNGKFGALFIVGTDDYEQKTKLRYYPNRHFAGFSFTNSTYGLENSAWLVGTKRAHDGAMEVRFALPLDVKPKDSRNELIGEIDALIQEAMEVACYD